MVTVSNGKPVPAGNIYALTRYGHPCMRLKHGFVNMDKVRAVMPNNPNVNGPSRSLQ